MRCMEAHPQPLQPPPPLVRQRALPPAVALLLQPGVQTRVLLLGLRRSKLAAPRPPLPCAAGASRSWCRGRRRHVAVAVLGMEGSQLAEARRPCIIKGVHTEP